MMLPLRVVRPWLSMLDETSCRRGDVRTDCDRSVRSEGGSGWGTLGEPNPSIGEDSGCSVRKARYSSASVSCVFCSVSALIAASRKGKGATFCAVMGKGAIQVIFLICSSDEKEDLTLCLQFDQESWATCFSTFNREWCQLEAIGANRPTERVRHGHVPTPR